MAVNNLILFDLYGTLILTHQHTGAWEAWQGRLLEFALKLGGKEKAAKGRDLIGDFWKGADKPAANSHTVFEFRINEFLLQLGITSPAETLTVIADELCDLWQTFLEVDPVAFLHLASLRSAFYIGLVTNFDHPPHVRKLLKSSGLDDFLEITVISGEEGTKKPDPEILHVACRRAGCEPSKTMYVGDSIVDYRAATSAGITPVLIRRPGQYEIENSRDNPSAFEDTDQYLVDLARRGELLMVKSLAEVGPVADRLWVRS